MSKTSRKIRIGTRGSQLAMTQTHMVRDLLLQNWPDLTIEIVEILTSGDWKPSDGETRLSAKEGGKGLFAKEIERAILEDKIDCGVHSMKDMPSVLPEGLAIDVVLRREDPHDAFLSDKAKCLADLPDGSVVGTSSTRRASFIKHHYPSLECVTFRGNVPTRIEKLRARQVDGTILALAGLKRLGLEHEVASIIDTNSMVPAACQGIVCVETRARDQGIKDLLAPLHCKETGLLAAIERSALKALDGSCQTPIGAYARYVDRGDGAQGGAREIAFDLCVLSLDGRDLYRKTAICLTDNVDDAAVFGAEIANILKPELPDGLFEEDGS